MFTNPSVADFKNYFIRDFPYGTDIETNVLDQDITQAFTLTNVNFPQDLWSDQGSYNVGYLYLSAHYLVMNMQTSSQGLNNQFNFLEQSKSVGSISQGFAIPDRVLQNPDWAVLMKTSYGAQFLQLVLPQLSGKVFSVFGPTKA